MKRREWGRGGGSGEGTERTEKKIVGSEGKDGESEN